MSGNRSHRDRGNLYIPLSFLTSYGKTRVACHDAGVRMTAKVRNTPVGHEAAVGSDGALRTLAIPGKEGGRGSSASGGELLVLALATSALCGVSAVRRAGRPIAVACGLALLALVWQGAQVARQRVTTLERVDDLILRMWTSLPAGPGYVVWDDDMHWRLRIRQELEGDRPDLVVVNPAMVGYPGERERFIAAHHFDPYAGADLGASAEPVDGGREPSPRTMKRGVPPTPRNARTGEFTPPGTNSWPRANNASDRAVFIPFLHLLSGVKRHSRRFPSELNAECF